MLAVLADTSSSVAVESRRQYDRFFPVVVPILNSGSIESLPGRKQVGRYREI
jgi:hypothetical protein